MDIGERIKQEREIRGWSLRDLSARCGVPFSSIHLIEQGKKDAQYSTLVRIFDAFGLYLVVSKKKN